MGDFKVENGQSRVGKLLRDIGKGDFIEKAGKMVGQGLSGNWFGAIQTLLKNDTDVSPEQEQQAADMYALDLQDRADARAMNVAIATSKESTSLAKNFIYYLSIGVFLFAAGMVILLFFKDIPDKNRDVVNFILGVVIGTGLTGLFNYFYGSSKGSSDKFKHIINGKNNN